MNKIPFHPIANLFPLMEGAEFNALVADIKAHGLREPIVIYEGKILDGRNRYRACRRLRYKLTNNHFRRVDVLVDDPVAYVTSANIHRRHLTAEGKRKVIAKLIKAQPEKSNRQIAKIAKVHHRKIGRIRKEEEDVGHLDHVEKRIDTRGRKQPAKKSTTAEDRKQPAKAPTTLDVKEQDPKSPVVIVEQAAAKQTDPEDLAPIYANPIAAAWRAADEADRSSFARHYGADVVRLMGQTEEAAA
jgi:hypothetical protein